MTIHDMETKAKTINETAGRKIGNAFFMVWNAIMDIIYLLAIMTVVSVAVYVAYANGVDHPAIIWGGEKVNNIWLNIGNYFRIGG